MERPVLTCLPWIEDRTCSWSASTILVIARPRRNKCRIFRKLDNVVS